MIDPTIANECYEKIIRIALCQEPVHDKYQLLHQVFVGVLNEHTMRSSLNFSGPYARFDFLCREIQYPEVAIRRVNAFRNRTRSASHTDERLLLEKWPCDMKAVAEFAAALYQVPLPAQLRSMLPLQYPKEEYQGVRTDCVRVVVRKINASGHTMEAQPIDSDERTITFSLYDPENEARDFVYMEKLVKPGDRVNLVRATLRDGVYWPEQVVFLPDLLIDVTTVAGCFKDYGNTPLQFLLSMLSDKVNSAPILLGNFASMMLDEEVHHKNVDTSYQKSAVNFFQKYAAKLAVCREIDGHFHTEAQRQQLIIRNMVRNKFGEIPDYDPAEVLLEPSFLSEILGLQGRMDLSQTNMRVIIEQKSGKRNFHTNGHMESHYVQVLLYRAVVHYNFGLPSSKIDTYLLYSKYDDGLLKEGPASKLLTEAMRIRNQIAWLLVMLGEGKAESLFGRLTPDLLNVNQLDSTFWNRYLLPQLEQALNPLHTADELTRKYYYRLMTFLAKEHLLTKVGTADREASGAAAMWNATTAEKCAAGNMLHELTIVALEENVPGEGIVRMVLAVDTERQTSLPNFREGDSVVVYPYELGNDPIATMTLLFKANITKMEPDRVTVELRDPQRNTNVFKTGDMKVRWTIEHDVIESTHTALYKSVAEILKANDDRRKLLLGQRPPLVDTTQQPLRQYGDFQPLVAKFVQARDYMLLIGPPGTGKTSFGLVNILTEQLSREQGPVLLLSFTNRAVNEICSKLVEQHIDFIRIGYASACPQAYRPYMIGEVAASCKTMNEVVGKLCYNRVFVSTTASMLSNTILFDLLQFPLAIIDEASQILDPHLLGVLCARHGNDNAIKRFVLIGDQKQLPAVVQQAEEVSEITDPSLRRLGILNCRQSLFERLIRINTEGRADDGYPPVPELVYMLTKQGRMHTEVADFASTAFYGGRLGVVPLDHQLGPLSMQFAPDDEWAGHLASHRMVMMAVKPEPDDGASLKIGEDKVNRAEAQVIARVTKTVYDLYAQNGKTFVPEQTVGIIVPYRHQIACVMECLKAFGIPSLLDVTIDTVERFQGSQRDVIIYGFTVRQRRQLDFLLGNIYNDQGTLVDRKLNVALTRAREQMVLVGNPQLLSCDPTFRALIEYVRRRGGYREA